MYIHIYKYMDYICIYVYIYTKFEVPGWYVDSPTVVRSLL